MINKIDNLIARKHLFKQLQMNRMDSLLTDSHTFRTKRIDKLVKPLIFIIWLGILFFCFSLSPYPVLAQTGINPTATPASPGEPSNVPDKVDIEPTARDDEIRQRLMDILEATGWFISPEVVVREGVVFLSGQAKNGDYRKWAGDLARNTQDVVAVVNQMELTEPSLWDLKPAFEELQNLWRGFIRSLPLVIFSLLILLLTIILTRCSARLIRRSLRKRVSNTLLLNVVGYTAGVITLLTGLFVVLQIAGLTNVATTVLGGTGLLGLILGIAFRDITENFLASIFLSVQNPFRSGDLVEIANIQGYVEALNTRVTILITLDGNHVQIPNATVYKSNIYNYTSSPNRRADFVIGIGYEDSISRAQDVALKVLEDHPAVLNDPEPLALVDSLGSATVNLRIYFWINGEEYGYFKVKSAIIRLTKLAFQDAGISMPDEAREMIFPRGVPVELVGEHEFGILPKSDSSPTPPPTEPESTSTSTKAEADLTSEAKKIKEQARESWQPGDGENLLLGSTDNDIP